MSNFPSSKNSERSPPLLVEWTNAWLEGIGHFNGGRFWHAHESWERGWLGLPADLKTWIQGLIQVSGSFHLIERGRLEPALRLALLARVKLASVPDGSARVIEVPGLDAWLANPVAAIPADPRLQAFPRWI